MIWYRKSKLACIVAVTMALIFTVCFAKNTLAADTSIYANSLLTPFLNAKSEHVYDKIQRQNNGCPKEHNAVWAEYYFNSIEFDASNDSAGYKNVINGILAGFDVFETESWLFGIMAGYGDSKLEQEQNSTKSDNFNFGLYGGYETGNWQLKSMFFGGYEKYKTNRAGNESEYNGYSASLDLELGYKIALNETKDFFLKPFAGVLGSYVTIEEAKEQGLGALTIGADSLTMAQARAGLELNGQIQRFSWYANAGIRRILTPDNTEIEVLTTDTKSKSIEMESDLSVSGALGVDYLLTEHLTLFANGQTCYSDRTDDSRSYYFNIGALYKFGCNDSKDKKEENNDVNEEPAVSEIIAEPVEVIAEKIQEADKTEILNDEPVVVNKEQAELLKSKQTAKIKLYEMPQFETNSDKLTPKSREIVKQIASALEQYPGAEVLIEGHTDSLGDDAANQQLSEKRAQKIAQTLKDEYKVSNSFSVIGKGETEPIVSNDTKENRAKNRRVEVIVISK
ncbi:hypothetical protein MASR1M68_08440 [Elusimicrobiota bacterium]